MTGSRKRILLAAAIVILILAFSGIGFAAEENRVFDYAGLFTVEEQERLEAEIADFREEYTVDLGILTVSDTDGKTSQEYADDFYDTYGLGMGSDFSGVLFLIDMDNREICLSTFAGGADVLTDQRVERVLDQAYGPLSSEDYAGSAERAIQTIARYMAQGVPADQYNYVEKVRSLTAVEIIAALVLAAVIAALPCIATVNRYKMKREHRLAKNYQLAYRAGSTFNFAHNDEQFLNRSVIRQRISTGSGTGGAGRGSSGRTTLHRSSSGRMHGGGRRKF